MVQDAAYGPGRRVLGPFDPFKGVMLDLGDYSPNCVTIWLSVHHYILDED